MVQFASEKLLAFINEIYFRDGNISTFLDVFCRLWCIFAFTLDLVIVPVGIRNTLFDCSFVRMNSSLLINQIYDVPESYNTEDNLSNDSLC